MEKDLEYYKKNAEEDYMTTPISVLRYITEMEQALRKHDVMQSLPEAKQKAIEAFTEVCNEPIPEGEGKEYLNAMIKMKAFMAGRCFEYEKAKGNVA